MRFATSCLHALGLDASVVVKWVLDNPATEPNTDVAFDFLDRIVDRETVWQPPHWLIEVIGVTSHKLPGLTGEHIACLGDFDWHVVDGFDVLKHAAELSEDIQHHYFDTLYHAVAIHTDSLLVTADHRYLNKAQHLGNIIDLPAWQDAL